MSNEVTITVKVTNNTKSDIDGINKGVKSIGTSAKQSSDQIDQSFVRARDNLGRFATSAKQTGEQVDQGFGRARDSLGRFVSQGSSGSQRVKTDFADLEGIWDKLGEAMGRLGNSISNGLTDLFNKAGGMDALKSAISGVALAIPIAVGGFLALGPALSIAAGAAAAAATALAGVGLSVGVLAIGFGGIGAALTAHNQQMAGAGKAASDTAEQEHAAAERIRSATITLKDAKESEKQASQDVTKAIAEVRQLPLRTRSRL
jgi:hypothetical protein